MQYQVLKIWLYDIETIPQPDQWNLKEHITYTHVQYM